MSLEFQDLIQVRQMSLYFQQHRELPGVAKEATDQGIASYILTHWDRFLAQYREWDDSPRDYDPRPGHLLLIKDVIRGGKVQVNYEGDQSNGRISKIYLDHSQACFYEEHLIVSEQKLHRLSVEPDGQKSYLLEAYHWDRRFLLAGEKQSVLIGPNGLQKEEAESSKVLHL